MVFKPMDEREFRRLLRIAGWSLKKSGFDYNLLNSRGKFMCTIKIAHGKRTKGNEIPAVYVKKAEKSFKEEGLQWPPKKK